MGSKIQGQSLLYSKLLVVCYVFVVITTWPVAEISMKGKFCSLWLPKMLGGPWPTWPTCLSRPCRSPPFTKKFAPSRRLLSRPKSHDDHKKAITFGFLQANTLALGQVLHALFVNIPLLSLWKVACGLGFCNQTTDTEKGKQRFCLLSTIFFHYFIKPLSLTYIRSYIAPWF